MLSSRLCSLAQAQCMAPTSGLNDGLASKANAFKGTWQRQQFTEHVATEGKREQREGLRIVRQCLDTRKYLDFELQRSVLEAPDHTHHTFDKYHACCDRCEKFNDKLEAWDDTCDRRREREHRDGCTFQGTHGCQHQSKNRPGCRGQRARGGEQDLCMWSGQQEQDQRTRCWQQEQWWRVGSRRWSQCTKRQRRGQDHHARHGRWTSRPCHQEQELRTGRQDQGRLRAQAR